MRRFAIAWLLLLVCAFAFVAGAQEAVNEETPEGMPEEPVVVAPIVVEESPASQPAPEETAPAPTTPRPARPSSRPYQLSRPGSPLPGVDTDARMGRSIMLDVRNLDIDNLLKLLGDAAGLTIVKDPAVQGPVTIIAPQPVTVAEALEILNAVLQVRGFTSVRQGQVLKVTTIDRAVQLTTETHIGTDPNAVPAGDRIITQLVPMKTLDASQVAADLAPLAMSEASLVPNIVTNSLYITDTATNVRRLLEIINEMEKRNMAGVRVFRLKYVAAEEMADLVLGVLSASGGGGGTSGAPYERRLLPTRTTTPTRPGQQAAARPTAAASVSGAAGVQVLTDPRTNSLIVMTSPERIEMLSQFLAEFDKPVDYSSTLAVIPLQNARADDMAALLGQVISGGTGAARTTTPTTTTPRTTGTTSSRTPGSSYLQQGQTQEGSGIVQANAEMQGGAVLTQAGDTSVGRSEGGEVVPLVDMTDITIVPDASTNSLIINGSPEKIAFVRSLVASLDVVPTQVLIQAIVAEVTLTKNTQLGVEFSYLAGNSDVSTNFGLHQENSSTFGDWSPLEGGLNWLVLKPDRFVGLLNMLKTDSDVNILSTPRVFTTSGKKGSIDVSTTVPFAKGQFVSDTGGISTSFDYQSVGIVLEVTPVIGQDGTVTMEVSQTADDLLRFEQLSTDLRLPVVAHREAGATVSVKDGDTVVLGGLISDRTTHTKTGIPILKDLPLIGPFFRNTTTDKEKVELLVFLTPHVVRNAEEARMLSAEEEALLKHLPKGLRICPPAEGADK